jgi:hypothetical protein
VEEVNTFVWPEPEVLGADPEPSAAFATMPASPAIESTALENCTERVRSECGYSCRKILTVYLK